MCIVLLEIDDNFNNSSFQLNLYSAHFDYICIRF